MKLVYPNEPKLFRIALVLAVIFWVVLILGTLGIALIYVALIFLFALFAQSAFITYIKGSGVKVTKAQFPDLYQRFQNCCEQVNFQGELPDVYLLRTDFFNALATRFLRRHYIVLFTDVVDALEHQQGAINYYIGHELGHIQRNHIRWGWILAPVLLLPILGSAYRRAEEYTCDRYGNACCENESDAVAALSAIVAGDTRWRQMNVSAYLEQVNITGEFWMSFNELTGEYPWLSKRMAWALALRRDTEPELPRRHPLAWLLSAFVPSVPGGGMALLVTVAMIGIIAAVALPAYNDYVETVELANQVYDEPAPADYLDQLSAENLLLVLDELRQVRDQVTQYHQDNGAYPATFTDLGWDTDLLISENGGMPLSLYDGGILLIEYGETNDGSVYFINEPAADENGELIWYCYGQNIAEELLPEVCR